jgi:hypothetical protein
VFLGEGRNTRSFWTENLNKSQSDILYVRQLSDHLNWEESPTLLGRVGRRRGCFIVHRENIQLLEIGVCRKKLL